MTEGRFIDIVGTIHQWLLREGLVVRKGPLSCAQGVGSVEDMGEGIQESCVFGFQVIKVEVMRWQELYSELWTVCSGTNTPTWC